MTSAIRIAVVIAVLIPATAFAIGNERIPLENWSYAAVERFESLGLCTLPDDRPFSRGEFETIVAAIAVAAQDRSLSARDRYELDRLAREYGTDGRRIDPSQRYDRAWIARDGAIAVEGDFDVRPFVEQRPGSSSVEAYAGTDPEVRVHLGDRVTYDVRYQILFGPEHGDRRGGQKPSRREKSFRGLTALFDRSYVIAAWDQVHVLVGRDYVDWGPSRNAGLLTPGERYGIDQIGARVFFRSFRFDAFYGQLFTDPERYLVGHRLEGTFGRTVVGLSETVTYGGRGPDMLYLLPIAWYYANQYNERTNADNILWSIDAKTSVLDRVTAYGTLLIDDFQFERSGGYPDKLGADVGVRWVPDRPLGLAVTGSYTWVDIYTYSHDDSLSVYVSGAGELSGGDVLLGGLPGPDSDAWRAAVEVFPRANLRVTAGAFGVRRGEGNMIHAFDIDTDPRDPPFPSGIVERTLGFDLAARWELDGDSWVSLAYTHASVDNVAHVAGSDDTRDGFRLEIRWDVP